MRSILKDPISDPDIERFRDGLVALHRDGNLVGYVATSLETFRTLFSRQRQWWVRLVVVLNDGTRHDKIEDYAPWTYVQEMLEGTFDWQLSTEDDGPMAVVWIPPDEAKRLRVDLDIKPEDF